VEAAPPGATKQPFSWPMSENGAKCLMSSTAMRELGRVLVEKNPGKWVIPGRRVGDVFDLRLDRFKASFTEEEIKEVAWRFYDFCIYLGEDRLEEVVHRSRKDAPLSEDEKRRDMLKRRVCGVAGIPCRESVVR